MEKKKFYGEELLGPQASLRVTPCPLIYERNVLNFLFAYKTYPPKYFHFGPKIRSLTESQ